jgi:hypothetical protein
MPFHSTLRVTLVTMADGSTRWRIDEPLTFESATAGQTFTVPAGFVTDFASVPRLPLAYLLTGDTAHAPAVVHDWLYVTRKVDRKTADAVFLEAMEETGVPWWRRRLMWIAVRALGGVVREDHQETAP